MLPWILAPFEDPKIGGVGTCQKVRRERTGPWSTRIWNWLGAAYIERRNFEISATHNIDGGTSCMSGRTGAYRSEILSSHDFLHGFRNEKWRKWILNADDDNFVIRWMVSHQWKTWIQYYRECELETTLENGHKFLQQLWCTYALHIATYTSLAFAIDPLLLASCCWATGDWETQNRKYAFWAQLVFMSGFTKVVKLMGLFLRNPGDIIFLPVSIAFGYMHGFIKAYALFTLSMKGRQTYGRRSDEGTWEKQEYAVYDSGTFLPPTLATEALIIEMASSAGDDDGEFDVTDDPFNYGSMSITSSVYACTYERGRRYNCFKDGQYPIPNDDQEQDREDIKHAMHMELTDGALFNSPIGDNPQSIMDIGTGTVGDKYPSARVCGIDLTSIQPLWVPPNVEFLVDDCEQDWLARNADLVHFRFMAVILKDIGLVLSHA
ncbi:hypothetical protein TOPH_02406 [Tolypocladium ophioglossoides CBS 100239]|uniref:Uncharacterized protein n=1 Tax=Tolypocladium ophioglossoides (strain CBS 100239) TaxID=1163406 RepID=A0A0L0NFS5_TOLOC|nr:hypothetical protein TOPH_02406 [Tolypocladium ophioglossoides CBS 100239]